MPKEYNNPDFMQKWAVIACDQYTSDAGYWERVKDFSGNNMSSLNLIFPEIYLERESEEQGGERIKNITLNMKKYADSLVCFENAMLLIERTLKNGAKRYGIVGAVDLEEYSYAEDSNAKIRSTEETVISRIPPRVKIRENADLELPHVMLLYNDERDTLIGGLKDAVKTENLKKIYDFKLMQESGEIKAYLLEAKNIEFVKNTLSELEAGFMFAVGDGNHSLATAKECYESLKKTTPDYLNHPARYALAEIVNIYDESLEFEPIHRILFDVEPSHVSEKMSESLTPEEARQVKPLQIFLDGYLEEYGGRIDYIHGERELAELAKQPGAIGFICETVPKSGFFEAIAKGGALPRKTFSMGEADDKRFYVECRKITLDKKITSDKTETKNETKNENINIKIEMEDGGVITAELYPETAPLTVDNFVSLAKSGFYDGLIFHRVIPGFMIQGGCPEGTGTGGPGHNIKGEFASNGVPNDLSHERGVMSMARAGDPDSAGSQFFIMVKAAPHLNRQYAAFGKVLTGMDIADKIAGAERNSKDKPLTDQKIKTVTVIP